MTAVTADPPVRVQAFGSTVRKLGHWTTARCFDVRVRRGGTVLDLRSRCVPPGDVEVHVDLEKAVLKLLVPDDATIDQWDLRVTGRGRVKDAYGRGTPDGRRIRLVGEINRSEIRVHRAGVAVLTALFTREFLAEARAARAAGRTPSVPDPAATPVPPTAPANVFNGR
jgi:hypothetical protein